MDKQYYLVYGQINEFENDARIICQCTYDEGMEWITKNISNIFDDSYNIQSRMESTKIEEFVGGYSIIKGYNNQIRVVNYSENIEYVYTLEPMDEIKSYGEIMLDTETLYQDFMVKVKIKDLFDRGLWTKYCQEYNKNEWAVNEGIMDMTEEVEVLASFIS